MPTAIINYELCFYCGIEIAKDLGENPYALKKHTDHYQPKSRGGSNEASNLVPACSECNLRKKDLEPGEWRDRCFTDVFMAISRLRWLIGKDAADRLFDVVNSYALRVPSLGGPSIGKSE